MSKKAVIIVAYEMFRDEEYADPKAVLEKAGFEITIASSKLGEATGRFGLKAKVDLTLDKVKVADYDAVLFIGGPGSHGYYQDPQAHRIAREAVEQEKILGAICAAPGILANAGLLKGKNATVHEGDAETLVSNGAFYTGKGIEVDGNIITADGPKNARRWGEEVVRLLGLPAGRQVVRPYGKF